MHLLKSKVNKFKYMAIFINKISTAATDERDIAHMPRASISVAAVDIFMLG